MRRIAPAQAESLFGTAVIRRIEARAADSLPPYTLMRRAGLAVARLALALAPHARTVWVACGPGNNGGDGFEAAMHLQAWGKNTVVTWTGAEDKAPADALASLRRARDAGVRFAGAAPAQCDLAIDALLGIGSTRPLEGRMAELARRINGCDAPRLAVDIPSGLSAGTGRADEVFVRATHTLSLLALKPGLFTAHGRDAAGEVWFDALQVDPLDEPPCALLQGRPREPARPHASHKGSFGDVAVIGGAPGMTGAALLAASAALRAGAGRVYVALLQHDGIAVDVSQPELMFRPPARLDLGRLAVACGCGGGDAVREVLARAISSAAHLVLDADALNAIAADTSLHTLLAARGRRGAPCVITPHPLEAARLLGRSAAEVQNDRLAAADELSRRYGCVTLLKGSGSVIARPRGLPAINPTGNARLATAGTGDVLAGMVAARLAHGEEAFAAACHAAWQHGAAADAWPAGTALTASALAAALGR